MPTYEYRCPNGHHFERFQKMSDEPRASCPECGVESERILSGGAGFLFKGEGFYVTDYRSESYKKEASREASPEVSKGGPEGGGKEGKTGDGGKDTASSPKEGKGSAQPPRSGESPGTES
jgi:putative FmdB family regulatory protein